jgi:hypothetical protein
MQQDNNHIENKLRQLENQQLPDLSAMDAHWKAMQTALAPGIVPRKKRSLKNNFKKLLFAASIVSVLIAVYFIKQHYNTEDKTKTVAGNATIAESAGQLKATAIDTPVKKIVIQVPGNYVKPTFKVKVLPAAPLSKVDSLFFIERTDTLKQAAAILNNTESSLGSFYNSIQKTAQQFTISAAKGGEIICKEGTKIAIPAAAFIDAEGKLIDAVVTINVQEFYKYSDMIAANLTTTSNGEQLITGGMIKLTATYNDREVQLRNDKALDLSMPTKNYDAEMQLFLADEGRKGNKIIQTSNTMNTIGDTTAAGNFYSRTFNWQLANAVKQLQFDGKTNFLNMEDEPVRVRETKTKRIAVFHITDELPMTEEESKQLLKERYGSYYDVIKVKRIRAERNILFSRVSIARKHIGDSVKLTLDRAIRWHYIDRKDSAFYAKKIKADSIRFVQGQIFVNSGLWKLSAFLQPGDSIYTQKIIDSLQLVYQKRQQVEQTYNFSIKKMGWINCDRFYNYNNKTDFVIDMPADVQADKFVTQLVFTNIRSVMPGQSYQNKIGFLNIPVNMPVYLVGLGERNGKVVSFMQSFKTSKSNVAVTNFEETTPEAFKEKIKQLDL